MERIKQVINDFIENLFKKKNNSENLNRPKSDLNKLRNRIEVLDEKKGVDSGFIENFRDKYFPAYNIEDLIESFENKNENKDKTDYVVRKEDGNNVMVYEYDMDNYKENEKDTTLLYDDNESLIVTDASTGKNYVYDKPTKQLLEYEKNTNMDNINKLKYLEKRLKKLEMVNDRKSVKIDFKDRNNVAKKLIKPAEITAEEEDLNLDYKIDSQQLLDGYQYTFSMLFKRLREIGFNEKTISKIFVDIGYNLTRANEMLKDLNILGNIESQIERGSDKIKEIKPEPKPEPVIEEDPDEELIQSIKSLENKENSSMSSIIYLVIILIIIIFVFFIITKLRKKNKNILVPSKVIQRTRYG